MMEPMAKRAWWIVAVVILAAAVVNLWWQNGRLVRKRVQAERARVAAEEVLRVRVDSVHPPRRAAEVQAAAADLLPATADDGAGDDAPPPARHWAVEFFTPHPGENLIAYRDRVLPVVQAVAAPQRKRVARWRDEFTRAAGLTDAQARELDATVAATGEQMKDRILQGVLSGELGMRTKPSTGVAFARDLLDLADGANQRFRASLSPTQLTALDDSRFDVVDYLFFATRWEDMLGVEE